MEFRGLVPKALLAGAESTEVLNCFGDDVVEELEVDATGLVCGAGKRQQLLVRVGGGAKMVMMMAPRSSAAGTGKEFWEGI